MKTHPINAAETDSQGRPGTRILIVDDDDIARGVHEAVLSLHGYGTESAADGVEALEMIALEDFDLVITDCRMPRLDGLGLIRAIRRVVASQVPIMMVSGTLATGEIPLDIRNEIAVALAKPVRLGDLLAGVAAALGRRQPTREHLLPQPSRVSCAPHPGEAEASRPNHSLAA